MFWTFGGRTRRMVTIVGASAAMAFPLASIGAGAASASPVHGSRAMSLFKGASVHAAVRADGSANCSGTANNPGVLVGGTYTSVTVSGVCGVLAGPVTVTGNVAVTGTGSLIAAFHYNNATNPPSGTSRLTVDGNLHIAPGGTAILGCSPAFGCLDDPNQNHPTLVGNTHTGGNLVSDGSLGTIVHSSTVKGDVLETGGGGGVGCQPVGIFAAFGAPPYSDYEDTAVGGNLTVTNIRTCWYGSLRDTVGGSVTLINNHLGDPDGNEVITDTVGGNLICENDLPAIQFGDSFEETSNHPDVVSGYAVGQCSFSVEQPNPAFAPPGQFGPGNPAGPAEHISTPSGVQAGYTMAASDGGAFPMGAPFLGSAATEPAATPYVGIGTNPGGIGYVVANANGGVDALGAGALLGLPGVPASAENPPHLNKPLVGVAASPLGDGYWTAAGDGGVFPNGVGTGFFGSLGDVKLNKPVVGIAPAPDGHGYYLVAADGGVFPMGPGTKYAGSTGDIPLNAPVVGIATDPVTGGYWLVAADGGVFDFNAPFFGSLGNIHLNKPIVGIVAAPTGNGYYLVAADGGVFPLGPGTHFQGSLGNVTLNAPIVGMGLG
jgi:hypothetical protein